jgi:hypothetical protein
MKLAAPRYAPKNGKGLRVSTTLKNYTNRKNKGKGIIVESKHNFIDRCFSTSQINAEPTALVYSIFYYYLKVNFAMKVTTRALIFQPDNVMNFETRNKNNY